MNECRGKHREYEKWFNFTTRLIERSKAFRRTRTLLNRYLLLREGGRL